MATIEPPSKPAMFPLLAVVFIGTLGFSIVLPFLVFLVTDLGGNAVVYGLIGATYSAFQLIGAPLMGRWSDRYGRRRILFLSQAGTFLAWGFFLLALLVPVTPLAAIENPLVGAFTLTIPLLILGFARALDGLTGGNVAVAQAYLADITTEKERSAGFGKLAVAQNLGFIVGPALAGLLGGSLLGDTGPVLGALLISGLALMAIGWWLPESQPCQWVNRPNPGSIRRVMGQEPRDCHEEQGPRRYSALTVLRLPGVGVLLVVHFLVYLGFNFYYVSFPVHASTGMAWSMTEVGFFLSYLSILMALVQGPLIGWLAPRIPDQYLMVAGGLILAAGFAAFSFSAPGAVWAGGALIALGNGLLWPALLSMLSQRAGSAAQGSVQGIAGSSGAVASIGGMIFGGMLYSGLAEQVFLVAAGIAALACLALAVGNHEDAKTQGEHTGHR